MSRVCAWLLAAMVAATLGTHAALAQPAVDDILTGAPLTGQVTGEFDTPESIVSVEASFAPPTAAGRATLSVTAKIQPGWHVYSLTQKPVGALPTTITLDASRDYRLAGEFRSNLPPKIVRQLGDELQEHEGEVTWQAPVEIASDVDPRSLKISGSARIQTCDGSKCLQPHTFAFAANMAAPAAATTSATVYSDPAGHARLTGRIEPKSVAPGGKVRLVIDLAPAEGWHVYELANRDAGAIGNKPTLIVLTNTTGLGFTGATTTSKAIAGEPLFEGAPPQRYYEGRVDWTTAIQIPKDAKPGEYPIEGTIGYQVCTNTGCDMPRGATFKGTIVVSAAASDKGASPLMFSEGKYGEAAKLAETIGTQRAAADAESTDALAGAAPDLLLVIIPAALLGGFLLNFMPCVLPVIGLKILSFAEQAGRSRKQILVLNIWYSLGLLSVFIVLAVLATGATLGLSETNLSWGQQFTSTTFNVVMVAIVFVMALSFLGIWELPIPGFVNTGTANNLAAREGAVGAFSKGVLATVLSTPCSGPFLGPVFGFLLKQPALVTFVVFGAMGLGMAAPYLLIGAFPRLIRFLPKPGAWMETFKHMMGFVLLGTIVFLFTIIDRDYLVPTFAMMIGLWAACWWIGRVSFTEPLSKRLKAWVQGAAVAAAVGFASFHWLTPQESLIAWQKFSRAEAERLSSEGHTVLVDFTAAWCPTCKWNLATVIETEDIKQAIDENKIVPLLADWTKPSDEIQLALESIQRNSIPQLVIYPAGKPKDPIVLSDLLTKKRVLDAITQAGPSQEVSKALAASAAQ